MRPNGHNPYIMKKCVGCGLCKGLIAFGRDSNRPDGLCVRCKPCRRAQVNRNRGTTTARIIDDDGPTSGDIAQQRKRDEAWVDEGAERLRANTDAVRPAGRAE